MLPQNLDYNVGSMRKLSFDGKCIRELEQDCHIICPRGMKAVQEIFAWLVLEGVSFLKLRNG